MAFLIPTDTWRPSGSFPTSTYTPLFPISFWIEPPSLLFVDISPMLVPVPPLCWLVLLLLEPEDFPPFLSISIVLQTNMSCVTRKCAFKIFVVVIPKEGMAARAPPVLPLVWQQLQNIILERRRVQFYSRCHTHKSIGGPMTMTKDLKVDFLVTHKFVYKTNKCLLKNWLVMLPSHWAFSFRVFLHSITSNQIVASLLSSFLKKSSKWSSFVYGVHWKFISSHKREHFSWLLGKAY